VRVAGAAVYLPSAGPVEEAAQYLPPALIQRLFRGRGAFRGDLRLPAADVDRRVHGVCIGCGSQDESFAGAAGGWDRASTGAGVAEGYQAGYAYAAVAGTYSYVISVFGEADQRLSGCSCAALSTDERTGISVTLVRVQ
jgi:hypothetical protein